MSTYYLQKGNIFALPIIHYNMETAALTHHLINYLKPDCIAVEFAETMQLQLLHAASRLPDISVIVAESQDQKPLFYLCEPCDASFEALRSALENKIPAFCIDLDVDYYPEIRQYLPDPYAISRIGLKTYYETYFQYKNDNDIIDKDRELYMAKRLKELSFSYDKILFVGGMDHVKNVLELIDQDRFPLLQHAPRENIQLATLTEQSCREVLAEFGYLSKKYEEDRNGEILLDRQKVIYSLLKEAGKKYGEKTNAFSHREMRNIMKFLRNYALIKNQLMPDLYQILTAAKGCVDNSYAYDTWELATSYPYLKNVDNLLELDLTPEDIWKSSKNIKFHLKQPGRKSFDFKKRKDKANFRFLPPSPFGICSYPPEDKIVENFGDFLKKKGKNILSDTFSKVIPFTTSIEDGIDIKETLRHWVEKKLYVKTKGKPPGEVSAVVVIFDEDSEGKEKYTWKTTWLGEHNQESDMALYATSLTQNIVGPGISQCEYGGFMMSSPPRRLMNIWNDRDYEECQTKAEVLLMAAIDYSIKSIVVYVAAKPPRAFLKNFAEKFGKKIVYLPIGSLSSHLLNRIKTFHVLDGHDKRNIADEYII